MQMKFGVKNCMLMGFGSSSFCGYWKFVLNGRVVLKINVL